MVEAAILAAAESVAEIPSGRLDWQPLPVELLPEPVGAFVRETSEGLGADSSLVALPLLAAVAATIGNRRRIEPWAGWQEPSVLWCLPVAESGSMKTPSANAALRFVRDRQREAFADSRAELAVWEDEKRAHDTARRSRSRAAEPPSDRPTADRYIVDDLTIESLAPILDSNPRGVLLDRDELAGWFDFDRYTSGRGGAEVARWLSIYNGGSITSDRKGAGTIYVPEAILSIAGGIQPRTLDRVVGSRHLDNGLLMRFILASPPRRPKTLPAGGPGFATVADMEGMFATLAGIPAAHNGAPVILDLTPDARAMFEDRWLELAHEQYNASGPVVAMLSKAEAWTLRLALVCHLIRQAGSEPTLAHRIDADSIERGIGLARWAAHEWQRVYHGIHGGSGSDERLVRFLKSRGGLTSVREVARTGPGEYRKPGAAEEGLRRLSQAGLLEWQTTPTAGRPADAVRLK